MQKAAPCRMVLVTMDPKANNGADVAPAVIVRAWSDTLVNVRVLRDGADVPWLTSVPLFQTRDELEQARQARAVQMAEAGITDALGSVWHAAYWPPRD